MQVYFLVLDPPFLQICVPFIPNMLAQTSTHSEVNHVGSDAKCSKKMSIFNNVSGLSLKTPQAKIIMGAERIIKTNSSL